MKFWVAQNDDGHIYLFTSKPERYEGFRNIHYWAIFSGKGIPILLNDGSHCLRYLDENKVVQCKYLADIMGFKRKTIKDGIIRWEGISMKEAREVELNFDLKIL